MKKMLKIIAMLLVITTVIFAAGCADKSDEGTEEVATENVTEATDAAGNLTDSEVVAEVTENVTDENMTDVENVTDENMTDVENVTDENMTDVENVTDVVVEEDATENVTTPTE